MMKPESGPEMSIEEKIKQLRAEQDNLLQEYHKTVDDARKKEIAARHKELAQIIEELLFGEVTQ